MLRLLEDWDHAPAYVINHRLDVLAKNRRAAARLRMSTSSRSRRFSRRNAASSSRSLLARVARTPRGTWLDISGSSSWLFLPTPGPA
ncbi:hypothetical protein [Planotetraspora silvatica]|uniref:MmyB family transcriptional regulator n=1 Tax=Planotetraspora silvatica TaxID=234614 RepID=UPI001951F2EA